MEFRRKTEPSHSGRSLACLLLPVQLTTDPTCPWGMEMRWHRVKDTDS